MVLILSLRMEEQHHAVIIYLVDDATIEITCALVQVGHAVEQRLSQCAVLELVDNGLEFVWVDVQELARQLMIPTVGRIGCSTFGCCDASSSVRDQIDSRDLGLFATRHKDNRRFGDRSSGRYFASDTRRCVLLDCLEDGLGHGDETRGVVRGVEALDVKLELEGTHVRVKVESAVGVGLQPLSHVLRVSYGRAKRHDANAAALAVLVAAAEL